MKKLIVFAAIVVVAGFTSKVMAQVTKPNTASAQIMSPITLNADVPLEFGRMAVQTATGGTAVLTAAAATSPSSTDGVTLMSGTTRTAAKYTVGGVASYVYTITVPQTAVTILSGTTPMTITDFTFASIASPSLTGGTLSASGADVFYVGATLNVGAAQATGTYSGSFDVTVNYN